MGANTPSTKGRIYRPAQCYYEFQTKPGRKYDTRTMEKPTLGISSSNIPVLDKLLAKGYEHISPNSAYEKHLKNLWDSLLISVKFII